MLLFFCCCCLIHPVIGEEENRGRVYIFVLCNCHEPASCLGGMRIARIFPRLESKSWLFTRSWHWQSKTKKKKKKVCSFDKLFFFFIPSEHHTNTETKRSNFPFHYEPECSIVRASSSLSCYLVIFSILFYILVPCASHRETLFV